MRLPTTTRGQAAREDARALHEAIWTAHGLGLRAVVPSSDGTIERDQLQLSSDLKKFWNRRGYALRTHQQPAKTGVELWLVPREEARET